jgi:hypothetical protein
VTGIAVAECGLQEGEHLDYDEVILAGPGSVVCDRSSGAAGTEPEPWADRD